MKRKPKQLKRKPGNKPMSDLKVLKKEVEAYECQAIIFLMQGMIENARKAIKANDHEAADNYLLKALRLNED